MKKKHNYLLYIINIVLPITIILLVLYLNNIYPFGKELLGKSDAFLQFKPMLYNLIMKLKTKTLLNYSFNNGLGNAFIFDFWYYLSSPLNLIALFFKSYNAMYLSSTLLKVIFTSICITFYVKKKTDNYLIIIISSISYVLSGWFLAYYYYLPWLDIYMIFPLFNYGLEELLNHHKYHIYILSLAYMLSTNMYLCFSVCIYTLIYFFIYILFIKKEKPKKKIIDFCYISLSTMVSFLLAFVFFYIFYDIIIKTGLSFSKTVKSPYTLTIGNIVKGLFYGTSDITINKSYPAYLNIGCSLIILFTIFNTLFNKKNKKFRLLFLSISILSILVITIPKLDFIMNDFHNIRGLTYRYSFIFVFLLIKAFIYAIPNIDINNKKINTLSIITIIVLYIIAWNSIPDHIKSFNITIFITYIIYLIFHNKIYFKKTIIIILFIIEILWGSAITIPLGIYLPQLKANFNKNNTTYRLAQMNIYMEHKNSNLYYNAKTTYTMTSVTYNNVIELFKSMGCETNENTYSDCYLNDDITNLLFNVKNQKNDYYLEKIYAVNKNIKSVSLNKNNNKITHENLIKGMTGIDNIYDKKTIKSTHEDNDYFYNIEEDFYIVKDGDKTYSSELPRLYTDNNNNITIYTINNDKLEEIYNYLSKNQIKYSYYNDNHIKGTINVDKGEMIFTSIPFDKDWIVKIDNKEVKPIKLLDSLIGINVSPGKHTIELEYKTHYLIPLLISLGTLIILIVDIIKERIR